MRITIDTDVLQRHNLSLGEYLVLLFPYLDYSYEVSKNKLEYNSMVSPDIYNDTFLVISNETKDLITRILTESDPKLKESPVKDFYALATRMMNLYPEGCKQGTSYPWKGTLEEIAQKLMVLVTVHDFIYTEEEAINAVKQYVDSFKDDRTHMKLLKYFLLKTKDKEIDSDFMTIIENNRE